MVSQGIWIAIAVGVFFACLGIGYAVLQSTTPATPMMMNQQQMQQMMNDPQAMNQWHQTMMNNPQAMNQWMNTMMNDPNLREQMYSQMFQNNQFMQGMMNNQQFQNQWRGPMMGSGGQMGMGMMQNQQFMQQMSPMMQDPEFRDLMVEQMLEHQQFMQELAQNTQFMSHLTMPALASDAAITEQELMQQLQTEESLLLLDMRDIELFDQGHIEGAATATCAEDKREKVISRIPKTVKMILVDQDGTQAPEMVQLLKDAGLDAKYLQGGMNTWQGKLVKDPGATQITPEELWNRIKQNDNLFLLDVRTPQEFLDYHIPGSVNIPLEYTFDAETVSMIPDDKDIIVICKSGTRATVASFALSRQGIAGEILEGGVVAWLDYINKKS